HLSRFTINNIQHDDCGLPKIYCVSNVHTLSYSAWTLQSFFGAIGHGANRSGKSSRLAPPSLVDIIPAIPTMTDGEKLRLSNSQTSTTSTALKPTYDIL